MDPEPTATTDRSSARASSNGHAVDEFGALSAQLRQELSGTLALWRRAFYVQKQALSLALIDSALKAAAGVAALCVAIALAISAALLTLFAVRRGFLLLFDGAWWSDLVLAALVVGLLAATGMLVRRAVHNSVLAGTKRRLAASAPPAPPVSSAAGRPS